MTNYAGLKNLADAAEKTRTIAGLKALRAKLRAEIPGKLNEGNLLLATWNIREFDSGRYGPRRDECYYYIAEIISRFDIVAVQEVRDGLYPLQRLLKRHLGDWWGFIVTDVTLGRSGNSERMAFFYDKRKVDFTGLAAELVLPKVDGEQESPIQFARSPYIAGFRAGWAYLTLVTVHIYYGESVPVDPRRLQELKDFGKTLTRNAGLFSAAPQYEFGAKPERDNLLILGDFNIFNRKDVTMEALTATGFIVPDELQQIPGSNVDKKKHYDQIAYYRKLDSMKPTGRAGVFDFYEAVYREADAAQYDKTREAKPGRSFKDWRTYQMSDHLPMWIEFDADAAEDYLDGLM
jgi:hypothetical protein